VFAGLGQLTFYRLDLEGELLSVINRIADFHHGHLIGAIGPHGETGIRRVFLEALVSTLRPAIDKGLHWDGLGHAARAIAEHHDVRRNLRQGDRRSIERQAVCRGNEQPARILLMTGDGLGHVRCCGRSKRHQSK
jgi:hypothetical protein